MSAIPQIPSLVGQVQIMAAALDVGTIDQTGQRALIIKPATRHGADHQAIVVPLDENAARTIGAALLAKHVVLPDTNGAP
jgi:hypothetical protein